MRLLILGGSQFVGPAVAADALSRGWDVTAVSRGTSGPPPEGVRWVRADRTRPDSLEPLTRERFDVVVDTWSGAPRVARDTARALAGSTGRWAYVSSRSVYAWPPARGADETAPTVAADPDAGATDYPADKRGSELALAREIGAERLIVLRAGLVLGPRDNVGRLPWWLRRIARGGPTVAPDHADLGIQYVDPRDLAALGLDALAAGRRGVVDVVCPVGTATLGGLLQACVEVTGSDSRLVWIDPDFLRANDITPWTDLPVWLPEDEVSYALHDSDASRAAEWGLRVRPVRETVADCWEWVRQVDASGEAPPPRDDVGLDPVREGALLAAWLAR